MAVSLAQLQSFAPFESITESQFEAVAPHVRLEKLPKGTFIIKRGKPLKVITFLVSGQVDLVDASFNSESVTGDSERAKKPLTEQSPSDVSALAKSEVEIVSVEHEAFEILDGWTDSTASDPAALGPSTNENGEDWMTSLLDSPLFAQIPPTQLQQLFVRFQSLQVDEGDTVIEESADGDYFYVIESGRAKVMTRFDGEVATLGPGSFFGEEALVGETIRNASVIMTTPGVLMRLDKEDFRALLQEPLIRYVDGEELNKRVLEGQSHTVVDVRLALEFRLGHVKDSINIPLAALRKRVSELDPNAVYVVTDDAGKRSEVAAHLLCQAGLTTYILKDSSSHYG